MIFILKILINYSHFGYGTNYDSYLSHSNINTGINGYTYFNKIFGRDMRVYWKAKWGVICKILGPLL